MTTLLRTEKLISQKGEEACKLQTAMTQVYLYEAVQKVNAAGNEAVACFVSGDEMKVMLMGMKRFTKMDPVNTKDLRRTIADIMIEKGGFPY